MTFQKSDILKDNFYSKKETIEDIIYEISSYMRDNNISENNNRLYDLTISYLLWALYYNKQDITVNLTKYRRSETNQWNYCLF